MRRLAAAIALVVAVGCEDGLAEPLDDPSLTLTVSPTNLTVERGGSAELIGTAVVSGAFTGAATVTVFGAPDDVTGVVGTPTESGNTTTVPVTLFVGGTSPLGTHAVTIRASGSGVTAEATVTLTIVSAGSTQVTVRPATIDDVLYNPGMGFTDSHFAYGYQYPEDSFISFGDYLNPPPYPDPADYPASTVSYFRWCWQDVEPAEGQIDFDRFDAIIARGAERSEGERLGFRIMTVGDDPECMPDWLTSKPGYVGFEVGRHVPDYGNPVFLEAVQQLYGRLGARYDGHPGMDHVDLGIVGCWGEWNSACLTERPHLCDVMGRSDADCLAAFERAIDIMLDAFPNTPTIMLGKSEGVLGSAMDYALGRGAGWRVDCLGDWGLFGPNWSHHTDEYPFVVDRAGDAWRRGPIHMEVCFTMTHMHFQFDMSVELVRQTFDWALDNHISVFNGKSVPVPAPYWPVVDDFLKRVGYRLVIDAATHPTVASPAESVVIDTQWKNLGVAPPYLPHQVAFRLRDSADLVVLQRASAADILEWLPGDHSSTDTMVLPADLAPGTYFLDVAILAPGGGEPAIDLAIEGRRPDGWYALSSIRVQ